MQNLGTEANPIVIDDSSTEESTEAMPLPLEIEEKSDAVSSEEDSSSEDEDLIPPIPSKKRSLPGFHPDGPPAKRMKVALHVEALKKLKGKADTNLAKVIELTNYLVHMRSQIGLMLEAQAEDQ